MLTCDTFIDLHRLKPKLILILHGFRHAILGQLCLARRGDRSHLDASSKYCTRRFIPNPLL
jgi:hypothetical protein